MLALFGLIASVVALPSLNQRQADPLSSLYFAGPVPSEPINKSPGIRDWGLPGGEPDSTDVGSGGTDPGDAFNAGACPNNPGADPAIGCITRRSDGNTLNLSISAVDGGAGINLSVWQQTCSKTPVAGYRNTNNVVGDVNWGDVVNDLKASTSDKYVPTLTQAIDDTGLAYINNVPKYFAALPLPTPLPGKAYAAPLGAFSFPTTSLQMFGYDGNDAFVYSIGSANTDGPAIDTNPTSMAAAGLAYIGQVLTSLRSWVSVSAATITWQEAATAWIALVTLRDFFNECLLTGYLVAAGETAQPGTRGPTLPLAIPSHDDIGAAAKEFAKGTWGTAKGLYADVSDLDKLSADPRAPVCAGG